MTTTPETPALPGDLTDETIERAEAAYREHVTTPSLTEVTCGCGARWTREDAGLLARRHRIERALAAARVAPVTPSNCICGPASVISDGPNVDCPNHGEPARRKPEGWSTADRREAEAEAGRRWGKRAGDPSTADYAAGAVTGFILGAEWQKARVALAATLPSPDREKLIAEVNALVDSLDEHVSHEDIGRALIAFRDGPLAALAVPPVVDEAKLAEVLRAAEVEYEDTMRDWTDEEGEPEMPSAFKARRAVERECEWLGAPRSPKVGGAE